MTDKMLFICAAAGSLAGVLVFDPFDHGFEANVFGVVFALCVLFGLSGLAKLVSRFCIRPVNGKHRLDESTRKN